MKWRKLFRAIHRDTGYIVAAITVVYVISGIAVNHIADWNPNYTFEDRSVDIGPLPQGDYAAMQAYVVDKLALDPQSVKGHFMESDTEFRVFLPEGQEVRVDVRTGKGKMKGITTRPVLYEANSMHLNTQKGIWTWIADLFAIALFVLVITGVFMMKGKRGLAGRGKWLVAAGFLVPIAFVWHLYS